MKIVIKRDAWKPWWERWVFVMCKESKRRKRNFRIDPQEALLRATDHNYSRQNCVLSFADGLQSAGHSVFIRRKDGPEVPHVNYYPTMLEYHLLGLVIGNGGDLPSPGLWDTFCWAMSRVPHRLRPNVLRYTAEHYFNRPGASQIEPLAPISLLIG